MRSSAKKSHWQKKMISRASFKLNGLIMNLHEGRNSTAEIDGGPCIIKKLCTEERWRVAFHNVNRHLDFLSQNAQVQMRKPQGLAAVITTIDEVLVNVSVNFNSFSTSKPRSPMISANSWRVLTPTTLSDAPLSMTACHGVHFLLLVSSMSALRCPTHAPVPLQS